MSVSQHTAGPWIPQRWWEQCDLSLDEQDNEDREAFLSAPYTSIFAVSVGRNVVNAHDCFEFRNSADAHLIAAAPDLLAALEETKKQLQWVLDELVDIDTLYSLCEPQEALQLAHNAINKAKGITE